MWVGTSWKMTKTLGQARDYARALAAATVPDSVQPFVIPPATAIATVAQELAGTRVLVGAQDAHWEDDGAWTGEVSVPQVKDAGAVLVEIGHSERRAHFGETDERVNAKVRAALRHGVLPLVCVGEDASVREGGGFVDAVVAQALAAYAGVPASVAGLIAYEPVWSIGTSGTAATPEQIAPVVAALAAECGRPVLYGGSVTVENSAELLAVPGVDGVFVGRAAWEVQGFLALCEAAGGR